MRRSFCSSSGVTCRPGWPHTAVAAAILTTALFGTFGPSLRAQTCGLSAVATAEQFDALSITSVNPQATRERSAKFILPAAADDAEALPLAFQNLNEHALHFDFLVGCFADRFSSLDLAQYQALVERRATRTYYAGVISRIRDAGEVFFGFDVITARNAEEILSQAEIKDVFLRLREGFQLTPLRYAPELPETREAARGWEPDSELPVHVTGGEVEVDFIPYTKATGYGWVKVLTLEKFEVANSTGQTTFRDILVLERSPRDIEGVVAGIITAEPQGELSHLSVRTARRGTPNAFVRGAVEAFASVAGKLIRLDVSDTTYTVTEIADVTEAEAFWESNRPQISALPTIDAEYDKLDSFAEMDFESEMPPESRYGGKASNLARLQRFIDPKFEEVGFAIPMRYYLEFLRSNQTASRLNPAVQVTYEQNLKELLQDPEFQSSPQFRSQALADWREFVRDNGEVDSALVERLRSRIEEVFGSAFTTVRFRSSSNVEDALEFNGAGLYESTSVCAVDDADFDDSGPSLCDVDQPRERTMQRALKKVWSSLWTFRAFEERAFYRIPQDSAAMGILVNRRFKGELANAVAFTGNPSNRFDRRYVVVVQEGEDASVVSPEPGEIAEKNVLEVDPSDGSLLRILREQGSSLLPPGEQVLTDDQLREVAFVLWQIDQNMPIDLGTHEREEVLLDVELKEEADGTLAFKQVRPFLTADPGPKPPTFAIRVAEGTELCGLWSDGRPLTEAHALQSRIQLKGGSVALPTAVNTFAADFIESVVLGPDQQVMEPIENGGIFTVTRRVGSTLGTELFGLSFEQTFQAGNQSLVVSLKDLEFVVTDGVAEQDEIVLDQEVITWSLSFTADIENDDGTSLIRYGSCTHEILPLNTTFIDLEGGHHIELDERYRKTAVGSAPADFVEARLTIGSEERVLTSYWDMVYTALRHNERVQGWFFLDPPVLVDGISVPVVQMSLEDFHRRPPLHIAGVSWLDADFQEIGRPEITRYCRSEPGEQCASDFRRGDTNGDGRVNLVDVIHIWENIFLGKRQLACPDAADFDDRNGVDITDPVLILNLLFRRVNLSAPPGPFECGPDPTADALPDCTATGC
jgi:hypothetical protein